MLDKLVDNGSFVLGSMAQKGSSTTLNGVSKSNLASDSSSDSDFRSILLKETSSSQLASDIKTSLNQNQNPDPNQNQIQNLDFDFGSMNIPSDINAEDIINQQLKKDAGSDIATFSKAFGQDLLTEILVENKDQDDRKDPVNLSSLFVPSMIEINSKDKMDLKDPLKLNLAISADSINQSQLVSKESDESAVFTPQNLNTKGSETESNSYLTNLNENPLLDKNLSQEIKNQLDPDTTSKPKSTDYIKSSELSLNTLKNSMFFGTKDVDLSSIKNSSHQSSSLAYNNGYNETQTDSLDLSGYSTDLKQTKTPIENYSSKEASSSDLSQALKTQTASPSRLDPMGSMNIVHKIPQTETLNSKSVDSAPSSQPISQKSFDPSTYYTIPSSSIYNYLEQNPVLANEKYLLQDNAQDSGTSSIDSNLDNYNYDVSVGSQTHSFQGLGTDNSVGSVNSTSTLSTVVSSLINEASFLVSSHKTSSTVNLEKYGLGKLTITIQKNPQNLRLNIDTTDQSVKDLLVQNISSLKESLEQNQLRFDGGIQIQSSTDTSWSFGSSPDDNSSTYQSNSGENAYQGQNQGSSDFLDQGHFSSYSEDSFDDGSYSSVNSSNSTQELKTDSSYSRKNISQTGKIQVLI